MALSCIISEIKKIVIFSYPTCIRCSCSGGLHQNIDIMFGMEILEWWSYKVKKFEDMFTCLDTMHERDTT